MQKNQKKCLTNLQLSVKIAEHLRQAPHGRKKLQKKLKKFLTKRTSCDTMYESSPNGEKPR